MLSKTSLTLLSLLVFSWNSSASADDWGSLRGCFVRKTATSGQNSEDPSNTTKKQSKAKAENPLEGMQNVIVWLEPTTPDRVIPAHPLLIPKTTNIVDLTIQNNRWSPRVLVFPSGSTLRVKNRDDHGHNLDPGFDFILRQASFLSGGKYRVVYDQTSLVGTTIGLAGKSVTKIENVPPWPYPVEYFSTDVPGKEIHRALMFSAPTPYYAVTDKQGRFLIKKFPVGKWRFVTWYKDFGYVQYVRIGGKPLRWKHGRFEFEIKAGKNNLGPVTVRKHPQPGSESLSVEETSKTK